MSTRIEWADEVNNITLGCRKVSSGCDSCYAVRTARVRAGNPHPAIAAAYAGLTHRTDDGLDWTGEVRLLPERLNRPLRWRKPRRIFIDSQSDLFHDQVPDEFIARAWAVMAASPRHTYQVLTKRHGRLRSLLSSDRFEPMVREAVRDGLDLHPDSIDWIERLPWPLTNVWVGVSVEDQRAADLRIPALLDTPAALRWLSCEPLLGPVDLAYVGPRRLGVLDSTGAGHGNGRYWASGPTIDWVVVGGETGARARPMHPVWAEKLRDQCRAARVPFFFKQWGDWSPMAPLNGAGAFDFSGAHALADDGTLYGPGELAWPDGPRRGEAMRANHQRAHLTSMYRVGKKKAGKELGGRVWEEFPGAHHEEVAVAH